MMFTSRLEPGVQRELFRLGYRNIRASNVGGFVAATLLGMTLWNMRQSPGVLIWSACALGSNGLAWFLLFAFRAASTLEGNALPVATVVRWRVMHTAFIVASACVWGGAGALLDIADPRSNVLILVAFLAVLAFAASSHGMHNLLSFVLSAVLSLPVMLSFLHNAFSESVLPVAVLFCLFALACAMIAVNANRTMIEAIRLRLANEALAVQHAEQASRADKASQDKSNFLAAAAHDMRQPVHALLMLQGLLRQTRAPEKYQAILDQMQVATETIGQLFSSVMELSKLESGLAKARMEPISIEAFVLERAKQHLPEAVQKGLRLKVHVSRAARGAWIHGDAFLLARVLDNLIGNALRYTSTGGVLVSVRKHSVRKLYLEVWDTGIGIQAEDLERIYDPYVQIDNEVRNRDKGLGLGLAIVKNSASLMAIPLEARSVPGRGSRFRLILNRVAAAPKPDLAVHSASPAADSPDLRGKNILVIEDDPMVTKALLAVLSLWGAQSRHALSADALDLGDWIPDLVICDQRLPGRHDGLTTLSRLQSVYPGVACILQTGEFSPEVPLKAQEKGFTLMMKPVTVEVFGRIVRECLSKKRV